MWQAFNGEYASCHGEEFPNSINCKQLCEHIVHQNNAIGLFLMIFLSQYSIHQRGTFPSQALAKVTWCHLLHCYSDSGIMQSWPICNQSNQSPGCEKTLTGSLKARINMESFSEAYLQRCTFHQRCRSPCARSWPEQHHTPGHWMDCQQ